METVGERGVGGRERDGRGERERVASKQREFDIRPFLLSSKMFPYQNSESKWIYAPLLK